MKDRPDLVVHTSTHWTNGDEASLSQLQGPCCRVKQESYDEEL